MKTCVCILALLITQPILAANSKISEKADKTVEAAKDLAGTTKDEITESFNQNIRKLDTEIDELRAKIRAQGNAADEELKMRLQEIENQRAHLKDRFQRLNASGQGAWQDVSNGLKNAWSELTNSLESAKNRFKKKE